MVQDVEEILFDESMVKTRVKEIAEEIAEDYIGKDLLLVGVLKGCMFFMADLIRFLEMPVSVDFMSVASYGALTETTGAVRILKDLDEVLENRHVLLVEDIVDTGLTLGYLLKNLKDRAPTSLRVCTLLDKPSYRLVRVPLDYRGFEVGRQFVVGYGLDYLEKYRHLPYVCVLKKDVCPL